MKVRVLGLFLMLSVLCILLPAQDEPNEDVLKPLFIKAIIYPSYSLSRLDYNIDTDKIELRVYLKITAGVLRGEIIDNAWVYINGSLISFCKRKKDYRARIKIDKKKLNNEVVLKIKTGDGRKISRKFTFPGWIVLNSPKPDIYENTGDISVKWGFSRYKFPLKVRVDDFKKGRNLTTVKEDVPDQVIIKAASLPPGGIVRIRIISDWFFKKYLKGNDIARGSEVNILPWAQAFIRIK
jgi:hypothetical protein